MFLVFRNTFETPPKKIFLPTKKKFIFFNYFNFRIASIAPSSRKKTKIQKKFLKKLRKFSSKKKFKFSENFPGTFGNKILKKTEKFFQIFFCSLNFCCCCCCCFQFKKLFRRKGRRATPFSVQFYFRPPKAKEDRKERQSCGCTTENRRKSVAGMENWLFCFFGCEIFSNVFKTNVFFFQPKDTPKKKNQLAANSFVFVEFRKKIQILEENFLEESFLEENFLENFFFFVFFVLRLKIFRKQNHKQKKQKLS